MSGRAGGPAAGGRAARGRGGRGRGGRGQGGRRDPGRKKSKHKTTVPELKGHIFDCGEIEDAGLYIKAKEALINYIRMSGANEASHIADSLEQLTLVGPPRPVRPPQIEGQNGIMVDDEIEVAIFEGELRGYAKRRNNFRVGCGRAYAIIWDMCTPGMKAKLRELRDYEEMTAQRNPVRILEAVANAVCGREEHQQPIYSLIQLQKILIMYHQRPDQNNEDFKEAFEALWDVFESQGGCMWAHPGLIRDRAIEIAEEMGRDPNEEGVPVPNMEDFEEAEEWVKPRVKAAMMLSAADGVRHDTLKDYLENRYVAEHVDAYPSNTTRLLSQLNNFRTTWTKKYRKKQPPRQEQDAEDYEEQVAFVQKDVQDEGRGENPRQVGMGEQKGVTFLQGKGRSMPQDKSEAQDLAQQEGPDKAKLKAKELKECTSVAKIPCMHCGGDHGMEDCPDLTDEQLGQILIQLEAWEDLQDDQQGELKGSMLQQGCDLGSMLNPNWVYVDTCTTVDQMVNRTFMSDIRVTNQKLNLQTNAGSASTNKKGFLGNTPFWLDPMGIANVVSLRTLESKFKVTYDSTQDGGAFVVHTPEGPVLIRRCPKTSFPYIDLTDEQGGAAIMMVQTVRQRYQGYTKKEVERAIEARKLQGRLGNPSEGQFKSQAKP